MHCGYYSWNRSAVTVKRCIVAIIHGTAPRFDTNMIFYYHSLMTTGYGPEENIGEESTPEAFHESQEINVCVHNERRRRSIKIPAC
jgi:hypothetical protein